MSKKQSDRLIWDTETEGGQDGPGSDEELGHRLSEVIQLIGTLQKASDIAGVTAEQFARWRDGKAKMPLKAAARVCAASGRSLDWLAFGRVSNVPAAQPAPEPGEPVDLDAMEAVIEAVSRELALQEKRLDPGDFGKLCRLVYEATRDKPDAEARRALTKSALRLVSIQ